MIFLCCALWHVQVAGLFNSKFGIYEAQSKSRELITVLFYRPLGSCIFQSLLMLVVFNIDQEFSLYL